MGKEGKKQGAVRNMLRETVGLTDLGWNIFAAAGANRPSTNETYGGESEELYLCDFLGQGICWQLAAGTHPEYYYKGQPAARLRGRPRRVPQSPREEEKKEKW